MRMAFFNLTQLGPQNLFQTARSSQTHLDGGHVHRNGSGRGQEAAAVGADRSAVAHHPPRHSLVEVTQCSTPVHVAKGETALLAEERSVGVYEKEERTLPVKTPSTSHTAAVYSPSQSAMQHGGSYTKYTELLRKHKRNPKGPMDLYTQPLTTSQMYGWWISDGEPHKEDWAQGPKHVHVNSEMTRFVDEMSQTNKEFTLY